MPRQNIVHKCHPPVKVLCKKAMCHNHLCRKTKSVSLLSGREINAYLLSLGSGYGRDSSVGISTEANALNDNEDYLVCANLKKYIDKSKKQERERVLDMIPKQEKDFVSMMQIVSP